MVSELHEALVELFHQDPALAAELLAGPLGVALPAWQKARPYSADLTDRSPAAGLIVEVQLGRDREKRRSWPAYVANLHRRLGCDAFLLVVCPNRSIARWCAKPIKLGHPGYVFTPLVLGPDRVPVVSDPTVARSHPELAVLSAMAHGGGPHQEPVLRAMLDGLGAVDGDHISLYTDVVMAALPEVARRCLEALMDFATYQPISPYFRRQRREGRAEGRAEAVLDVLEARGIEVTQAARDQIMACKDLRRIKAWTRRAITATTIEDVLR